MNAASPHHLAASYVVHAAYASGQNAIYLAAGVAALLGGLLVLAFVRPERPAETVPAPGTAEPSDAGVTAASDRTGRAPAQFRSALS